MKQPDFLKSLFKGNLPEKDEIKIRDPQKISQDRIRNSNLYSNIFYKDLDFETVIPKGVQIMFMSKEELEKISVVNIKNVEKREKFDGTIQDKKMGPPFMPRGYLCVTCQLPHDKCPGHLGRIDFFMPVINIWVYKYVIYILESICLECGNLLIPSDMAKRFSKSSDRLKKIATESKKGTYKCRVVGCPNKDQSNPSFEAKTDTMIKVRYKNSNDGISSTKILRLFQNLSKEDLESLGFSQSGPYNIHPKNFISESRAVLPVNHRPPEFNGTNQPNHLTTKYNSIVKINSLLKDGNITDRINPISLEREITSISHRDKVDSSTSNVQNTNDSSKNIDEMIAHKKGLIRTKAQGKRVDHTGRTVLGPGGLDVPFGWVKLPDKMRKFTIKERVCDHNIEYLKDKLNDGTIITVRTVDKNIVVAKRHANFVLKNGMIVERMTQDGDVVLFDRNPTLYKNSFMGYIAKFDDSLTIGLHSSVTKSHNADFDGDEGNIHVCPDYFSRAEIIHLSGSWNHVVAGQFSRPLMGLVFNAATSCYLMTEPDRIINDKDWDIYMKKVFFNSDRIKSLETRAKKHRKEEKTGPVLFSALLPENFYYHHSSGVEIKEGILVKGRIKKSHIGPSYNSIIHNLYLNYGTQVVSQFLSEGQNIADMFLERIGFTVGYRDCSMPEEEAKVKEVVGKELEEAGRKIKSISNLKDNPHYEIRKFYNESMNVIFGNIKTNGHEKIANALPDTNSLKIMADCGAKGSVTDIAQVIGLVGQQFVNNERPIMVFNKENGKNEGLRFLPYYDILHEGEPEKILNRGFVDRPLGKGMRPGQYVAHMMDSRVTLIQQALETSDTGQNQHNITKAMEDLRYSYNGTICNETGNVVQYAGGYDSYEPMEMLKVKIPGFGEIWSPIDIQSIVDMLNQE